MLEQEQNTLLTDLWACTRVTNKPKGRRPEGFWSPEGKPTKPEAKCFAPILTWYASQKKINLEKQTSSVQD